MSPLTKALFISSVLVPIAILVYVDWEEQKLPPHERGWGMLIFFFSNFFTFWFLFGSAVLFWIYERGYFKYTLGILFDYIVLVFLVISAVFSVMFFGARAIADWCEENLAGSLFSAPFLRDMVPISILGTAIGSVSALIITIPIKLIVYLKKNCNSCTSLSL